MENKWSLMTKDYELTDRAIVTRKIKAPKLLKSLDVTIGFPGWTADNNGVLAYIPLPKNITEEPEVWKSEYRGDELPTKNQRYIVCLQWIPTFAHGWVFSNTHNRYKITDLCFNAAKNSWLAVPQGWEVLGWMEYPKPFRKK